MVANLDARTAEAMSARKLGHRRLKRTDTNNALIVLCRFLRGPRQLSDAEGGKVDKWMMVKEDIWLSWAQLIVALPF